jgi:hypothetical protein
MHSLLFILEPAGERCLDDLKFQIDRIKAGDLSLAEEILISQTQILQSVFNEQIQQAVRTEMVPQGEYHSKMVFRAQALCQRTLRTLLEFKNPKRATFIKQQNNLQINEGAEKNENKSEPANELLEVNHYAWLDFRTPQETVKSDTAVGALAEGNRPED